MRILYISGYDAWTQISEGRKPSHHLFGMHQLIDHYEKRDDGTIYGILKKHTIKNIEKGEVDFYLWESVKKDILKHILFLIKESYKYDLIYDCLNKGSLWIGILKRLGIIKAKIITILHHPPYYISLLLEKSDAYVFFNEKYKKIATKERKSLANKYYINEWYPDSSWYDKIKKKTGFTDANFIDNGKTERDREMMISTAENSKIAIDYASNTSQTMKYARPYKIDLSDYTDIAAKLKSYKAIVIPIKKFKKPTIGPLGITSFLDAIAIGCPVITSDNTCFAEDVLKNKLGITYLTGDKNSMESGLYKMQNDQSYYDECKKNMEKYREGKTIEKYACTLVEIINSIL